MKKNKNKSKSAAYPLLQVFIVIVIFLLIDFWSVGSFENYKKMSGFRRAILTSDFKFKEFPPNELFGIKLFDNIEKYLLVDKEQIRKNNINNKVYLKIWQSSHSKEPKLKFTNPIPLNAEEIEIYAKENGEIVGILVGYELELNSNNFLKVCTNTRSAFLKKHNLSKLDFKNEYFKESKTYPKTFFDFKNFDFTIKSKNEEISKPQEVRFTIFCVHDIYRNNIDYAFVFFIHNLILWHDLVNEHSIVPTNKITNDLITKYRNSKK